MDKEHAALVKRLRQTTKSGPPSWIDTPINPAGPDAADAIEGLSRQLAVARHEGWNDAIEVAARMVEPADSADRDVARILQMAAAGIRSLLRDEGGSHD